MAEMIGVEVFRFPSSSCASSTAPHTVAATQKAVQDLGRVNTSRKETTYEGSVVKIDK
jgi:hypothetical protein